MWSSRKLSLAANFYILAYRFLFVKNFFQVFSNFFPIRSLSCRSRDSFHILSLHPSFVNTFLREITFILKLDLSILIYTLSLLFQPFPDYYSMIVPSLYHLYAGGRYIIKRIVLYNRTYSQYTRYIERRNTSWENSYSLSFFLFYYLDAPERIKSQRSRYTQ